MSGLIQFKRSATQAAWVASPVVLAAGEPGAALDTGEIRIGNGTDLWKDLPTRAVPAAYAPAAGTTANRPTSATLGLPYFDTTLNRLIVWNGNGWVNVDGSSLGGTAPATPAAGFTGTPLTGSAPLTVQFTSTSTGSPTSYAWAFGDGTTSTAQNPSKTYASAGTYTVSLTVTNASGSNTFTRTGYVAATAVTALQSDSFTGADGTAWSSSLWALTLPTLGGGATEQGNAGRLQTGRSGGYTPNDAIRARAKLATLPADFDATFTAKFDGSEIYPTFVYRSTTQDLGVASSYTLEFNQQANALTLSRWSNFTQSTLGTFAFTFVTGTLYKIRIRAVGTSHQVKVWAASASEPTAWAITGTSNTQTAAGELGVVASGGGAAVSGQVVIDDFVVMTP